MRNFTVYFGVLFATILLSANAFAEGFHAGNITKYHLNPQAPNRGACIQMEPSIPSPNNWACLNDISEPLYKERDALLLSGNTSKRLCTIWWDTVGNHANITLVECK